MLEDSPSRSIKRFLVGEDPRNREPHESLTRVLVLQLDTDVLVPNFRKDLRGLMESIEIDYGCNMSHELEIEDARHSPMSTVYDI